MPPTSKDHEVLVAAPEAPATTPASTFRPDETASRPNPVALEVPVTVNGARTVEGSDKRVPFSETTKTVLVFGNGAVIRLSSPVAAGQLLFLTNEKTKKEVVCQVVKSKNYRNVSGYVELEFTESVVGFWGMRFPTDRPASAPAPTTGAAAPPVAKTTPLPPGPKAPEVKAPAATVLPTPTSAIPPITGLKTPAPASVAPPQAVAPKAPPPAPVAKTSEAPASPAPNIAASLASSVASLLGSPEVPPAATPKSPAPQPAAPNTSAAQSGEASTEELKQQAARLQAQLSSMLFGGTTAGAQPPAPVNPQPTGESKPAASLTSKVLEMAKPEPLQPPKLVSAGKPAAPAQSSLDSEEVKIPSWLEPLARNAAAPTSTQELIDREKAKHAAEQTTRDHEEAKPEPLAAVPLAAAPGGAPEPEIAPLGNLLPSESETLTQPAQTGSKRGLWIGVAAAAILAAAGGAWYFLRPTTGASNTVSQNTRPTPSATSAPAPAIQPTPQPAPQISTAAAPQTSKAAVSEPRVSAPVSATPLPAQPTALNREARASSTPVPAASTERITRSAPVPSAPATAAAAKPEPKKPSIGEVHLATPNLNRAANTSENGLAAPTISNENAAASSGLAAGLVSGSSSQPAAPKAPLPVGGDVKPAKLLASAAPMYPSLAKAQHVSGDVSIDALIDATGKVTTMKVLSGPTLLRQAAMDAVRQWKYQAATLDGSPVAMHLTVTVQFRIQ